MIGAFMACVVFNTPISNARRGSPVSHSSVLIESLWQTTEIKPLRSTKSRRCRRIWLISRINSSAPSLNCQRSSYRLRSVQTLGLQSLPQVALRSVMPLHPQFGMQQDLSPFNPEIQSTQNHIQAIKVHTATNSAREVDMVIEETKRTLFTPRISGFCIRDTREIKLPSIETAYFIKHAVTNAQLWNLSQAVTEPLRVYITIFKKIMVAILGLSDSAALSAFRNGLWHESRFRKELDVNRPATIPNALHQATNWINAEEERMNGKATKFAAGEITEVDVSELKQMQAHNQVAEIEKLSPPSKKVKTSRARAEMNVSGNSALHLGKQCTLPRKHLALPRLALISPRVSYYASKPLTRPRSRIVALSRGDKINHPEAASSVTSPSREKETRGEVFRSIEAKTYQF
ncbi:Retrotransposon gag domain [Arabidopsis suecica]|uniref:Retrotransposon gag domain n=1 Tax=Arabidopsis suecica TaxID=45249 RepID=A0A8T1XVU8_ARASU|nr:Retrotransposon gag domain [Arabidopsis suecica]